MASCEKAPDTNNEVICPECGAKYDRLPAYTCPRCGAALCKSGCEGCTKHCAAAGVKPENSQVSKQKR